MSVNLDKAHVMRSISVDVFVSYKRYTSHTHMQHIPQEYNIIINDSTMRIVNADITLAGDMVTAAW